MSAFVPFVKAMACLSRYSPTAKPPKLLNGHLATRSLFPDIETASVSARNISDFEVRRLSDSYYASARSTQQAVIFEKLLDVQLGLTSPDDSSTSPDSTKNSASAPRDDFLCDVPLPNVIRRQISQPSSIYAQQTALGKIAGFRIEVNGKRGTRSGRQVVQYGKLGTKDSHNSLVDFGKSFYFNKKGSTGVKVWISYGQ